MTVTESVPQPAPRPSVGAQLAEVGAEMVRQSRARIEERGDQLLFYVKALAWTPRAVRRYKREIMSTLAEVAFGVGGLNSLLAALPSWVMAGLSAAGGMMIGIGFAILVSMIWSREAGAFFFLGYVLVAYLKLDVIPVAILGTVAALTLYFIDRDIINAKGRAQAAQLANTEEEFF